MSRYLIALAAIVVLTSCAQQIEQDHCTVSQLDMREAQAYARSHPSYKPTCYGAIIRGACTGPMI